MDTSDPAQRIGAGSLTIEEESTLPSAAFAHSPIGMAFIDPDSVIRAANASFAQQMRVPDEQVVGRPAEEVTPGWMEQVGDIYREVRESGKPFKAEAYPFEFKDQPERGVTYWDASVCPVYAAENVFLGYLLWLQEVTERKRAEETLFEERGKAEKYLDVAEVSIVVINADEKITLINRKGCRVLGYEEKEIIGTNWFDAFLPTRTREEVRAAFRKLLGGEVEPVEYYENPVLTKSGEERIIAWHNAVLRDQEGKISAVLSSGQDITERRRAEEERDRLLAEVQRRVAQLDVVIENTDAQLALFDREFRFVMVNAAYTKDSGHTKEELIGRNHFDLFPNPDNQAIFERVRDTGEPYRAVEKPFEYPEQPWRGVTYWNWTLAPIKRDGRVEGLLLSLINVTPQVRARQQEELVRAAQHRADVLDATITSIADGVVIYGPTGEIVRMNPAAERILGYTPTEPKVPLTEWVALLGIETPEGKPFPPAQLPAPRALRGETVLGAVMVVHLPDGRTIWLSSNAAPIPTPEGGLLGAVLTLTDITERKRAEEERERLLEVVQGERNRLRVLIDTAPTGICFYSAPDGLLLFNKTAEIIFGRPLVPEVRLADEPAHYGIYRPTGGPFPPEELPASRSLRGEACVGVTMLVRQPSGREVYILANSAPLLDAQRRIVGAVTVFQDITSIKEQEQMRDEFLSAAAHELKTPVATIKGYAQLMSKWAPEGHEPRERIAFDVVNRQCDRINRRVEEMLQAVRFRRVSPELHWVRFDLSELASEVVLRVQATTQIHRLVLRREAPAPVEADRERIEEVLVCLLDNAVKFSPKGGDVEVRVCIREGEAIVAVRDHGVGIPRERQPHIFEPFYEPLPAGAPGYRGVVALSLYLSKLIVERHKGRIWFESEEGQGSTFYFSLPLS